MSVKIIQDRLDTYQCKSAQEEQNALREITQEVVLAALSRTSFFKHAGFQGGTCLRIFYSLNRFSEDMNFITRKPLPDFSVDAYMKNICLELEAFGYQPEVRDRSIADSAVKKMFIKDDALGKVLRLNHPGSDGRMQNIKIKIEVDTHPPMVSRFDNKFCDFPFAFSAAVQELAGLFAGKIHALLCRDYAKGRDWYDFLWYTARGTRVDFEFLSAALNQSGPWTGSHIAVDQHWCINALQERIDSLDWKAVRRDVLRFIKPNEVASLEVWGREFFLDRLQRYAEKQ